MLDDALIEAGHRGRSRGTLLFQKRDWARLKWL